MCLLHFTAQCNHTTFHQVENCARRQNSRPNCALVSTPVLDYTARLCDDCSKKPTYSGEDDLALRLNDYKKFGRLVTERDRQVHEEKIKKVGRAACEAIARLTGDVKVIERDQALGMLEGELKAQFDPKEAGFSSYPDFAINTLKRMREEGMSF